MSKPREGWQNIPGHCHKVIGIWDPDNGDKAGKVCEVCRRWNEFDALSARNAELESQRKQYEADCARIEYFTDLHDKHSDVVRENKSLRAQLHDSKVSLAKAEIESGENKMIQAGKDAAVTELRSLLSDLESDRDFQHAQRMELQDAATKLGAELAVAKVELNSHQRNASNYEKQIHELRAQLVTANNKLYDLSNVELKLSAAVRERNECRKALAEKDVELKSANDKLNDLSKNCISLMLHESRMQAASDEIAGRSAIQEQTLDMLNESQAENKKLREALEKIIGGLSEKGPRVLASEALARTNKLQGGG